MVKNAIKVYARLRPVKNRKATLNYTVHHRPKENLDEDFLILVSPAQKPKEYPDNRPESWNYSFFRVFEESATQEDVFENVARPVMDSALEGYNGTIFAYGQTASGKTHSIIGSQGTSDGRGIIPRSLQYLFNVIEKRPENLYTIEVAFLEIYNENGYDLLDRRQREYAVTRLEDLPRVAIQEDENGQLHLKNLSFHGVRSLEDAFELLLVGDSNRVTTETPMNPQSSRSHCIFTIVVSMKEFGADHYKRAKVHLVDLAGSERVYKCSISGTILTEAKHINLSLHYLEQVIVCLGQESVAHIPYRNSYLTSILRDSLGGNCMTAMLANLSAVSSNLEETVSTCRFAQRVALIKNDVNLVLETSIQSENALLKLENEKLKQQIRAMTGQTHFEELTAEDKWKLDGQIRNFFDSNVKISWDCNPKSVEYCFDSIRRMLELSRDPKSCLKKLEYYKDLVYQRDKEISLLIDLLNKGKGKTENCLKEGLPDDGNLRLTGESRTLNSEEFQLNPDNDLTKIENVRLDVDPTVTGVPEEKIHSTPRRNYKKRSKDCKPALQSHADSQQTVINERKSNCNFLANNIANVRSRKNSLEQTSTELFRCNVVNVTLDDSSASKSIDREETRQSVRRSEKKQARSDETKKSMTKNARPKCNTLSGVIINEENDEGSASKDIKESIDKSGGSFYEKMLRFNVPRSEIKSSDNILKSQFPKSNSPTENHEKIFGNSFRVNRDFSKFAENFDTVNHAGNYSTVDSRGRLQNGDQRCASSQRQVEPLQVAIAGSGIRKEDMLAQSTRSDVCFSNRETESKRSDRKSSVRSFTPDRLEKFSARSKAEEDSHQMSDRGSNNGSFENSLPLTGDPEIDEEIIAFYKAKRLGDIF